MSGHGPALSTGLALAPFCLLALVALACADGRWPRGFAITKVAATACLLLVAGPNRTFLGGHVALGLVLSALGDAALVRKQQRPFFLAGMGFFLSAHGVYATAFLGGGGARPSALTGAVTVVAAAGVAVLLRHLWDDVHPTLRIPVVVYGVAITVMVGAASTLVTGPWPAPLGITVLVGAALFYLGDAALALSLFGRPFAHSQSISMALYWSGQLGFALAARWH